MAMKCPSVECFKTGKEVLVGFSGKVPDPGETAVVNCLFTRCSEACQGTAYVRRPKSHKGRWTITSIMVPPENE